jgi:hypothetical protein
MERRRIRHDTTVEERLASHAQRLREKAEKLPLGKERDALLRRARQAETDTPLNELLTSSTPPPPK